MLDKDAEVINIVQELVGQLEERTKHVGCHVVGRAVPPFNTRIE